MTPRIAFLYATRFAFNGLLITSAVYCLLCYIPFTNQNLIQSEMLAWLTTFVRLEPWLFLLLAAATCLTLIPPVSPEASRIGLLIPVAVLAIFSVWAKVWEPLEDAGMHDATLRIALLHLVPIIVVALSDIRYGLGRLEIAEEEPAEPARLLIALPTTAVLVATTFFAVGLVRAPQDLLGSADVRFLAMLGIASQLFIAMLMLMILLTLRAAAALAPSIDTAIEIVFVGLIASGSLAWMMYRIVFRPLAFEGEAAMGFAIALGASLVLAFAGNAARAMGVESVPIESATDFALAGIGLPRTSGRTGYVVVTVLVVLAGGLATWRLASFDWDFLLQKLLTIATWVFATGTIFRIARFTRVKDGTFAALFVALGVLGGYAVLVNDEKAAARSLGARDPGKTASDWRGYDVAFRLVTDAFSHNPATAERDDLYSFLGKNTNISRAIRTDPVDVNLVPTLTSSSGPRPNIFIIVIDSLRRDYVGAYNPKVTFTPHIDELARDGVAFRNSFSHYGATGLAEPSIWVGGMLLHKQYVLPFHPMNALEKLVEAENYHVLLGPDSVLDIITRPTPSVKRLAHQGPSQDLCGTLADLERTVAAMPSDGRPTFVYLQPLNIHISTINREGANVPDGESYPGFHEPTAWRLRRMDTCIGNFAGFLKQRGLYDSSIIALTSDHGDSLGEGGRYGHAYTITPEVLRVPLIAKIPKAMEPALAYDPEAIAFTTDLTPTLYYLLGHTEIRPSRIFGRPLFTATLDERKPFLEANEYLVASSYGPVYGLLSDAGQRLYIADAVNFRDSVYEMVPGQEPVESSPTDDERKESRAKIRSMVAEIAAFYKFRPPAAQ